MTHLSGRVQAGAILSLVGLHVAINGYAFGGCTHGRPFTSPSSDHANIVPWVRWYADPSLYPSDYAIQMGASYQTLLWPAVGVMSRVVPIAWAFLGLHLLSLAATFLMVIRLTRLWSDTDAAGLLACLLLIVARVSPAGEPTTDAAFYTRGAALPLALAGLLLIWRGRPYLGFLMLILTMPIHSLTAFYASAVGVIAWLITPGVSNSRRIVPVAAFASSAALAGRLLSGAEQIRLGSPSSFWLELQHRTNGGHVFVREWGASAWREFAVCALLLISVVLWHDSPRSRRPALAIALAAVLLIAIGWLTTGPLPSMLFMQLQPLRALKLTMVLSLIFAATWITSAAKRSWAGDDAVVAGWLRFLGPALVATGLLSHQNHVCLLGIVLATEPSAGRWRALLTLLGGIAVLAWFAVAELPDARGAFTPSNVMSVVMAIVTALILARLWSRRATNRASSLIVSVLSCLAAIGVTPLQRDGVTSYSTWDFPFLSPGRAAGEAPRPATPDAPEPAILRMVADEWIDVQRWAAAKTPKNALFLVPPWLEGFRTYSQRSLFVDFKQGTLSIFHESFGAEWANRMGRLNRRPLSDNPTEDMALNYDQLTASEVRELVTDYGITHILVRTARADLPYPLVYSNSYFRVLATGIGRG